MVKWNLDDIYKFKDTNKLIKEIEKRTECFKKYREKLSKISPKDFMKLVKELEDINKILTRLAHYAELWFTENTADSERNAYRERIAEIYTESENATLFFDIWFKELPDDKANEYIKNSGNYHYFLKRIRDFKKYTLSEKEEQIINLKSLTGSESATKFFDIITNKFKFHFKGKEYSNAEIAVFRKSKKRDERKGAYDVFLKKYQDEEQVIGEIYRTIVNDWKNENIKIRKFKSPIDVRLFSQDLPEQSINSLLKVVRKNAKLFQEYFELKKKLCGLDKIDRYDIYIPYKEDKTKYSFESSKELTLKVYKDFDEKMYELAKKVFDEQHVHSEIIPNKLKGAYCHYILPETTPYVLLNHMGKLEDVSTMVHEIGHAIHGMLSKDQNLFTFHAILPLCETASVFGELLLGEYLLKKSSKEQKKSILVEVFDGYWMTIIRQAYFFIFEQEAHQKMSEGATIEEIDKIYLENLKEQFGSEVEIPEIFKNEWKLVPHFYHTPFYCYAYAFGNLLVLALYKMYEKEGSSFIPKYLKILSAGGSESPEDILKKVDIDITKEDFWQQGFDVIKEQLETLKKLTNESSDK